MASQLVSVLGGPIFDGISKVIDSIKGKNPGDAAKLQEIATNYQIEILQAQTELAKATIDENVALNATAAGNIQAESKAGWVQSLARPSVIWMGNGVIVWNYIARPMFIRWKLAPVELPEMFWYVWCACVLGYVVTRTGQDVLNKVMGGAGGTVEGLGMKLNSKGD